jgi:hypothetical protein
MFGAILSDHLHRYPDLQIPDLYKLIHQAARGSGHAVPDSDAARRRLERELADLGDGPVEPVIDPISAGGGIVRVHLRPYQASGGRPETLLAAFIRTANEYNGGADLVVQYWSVARDLAERNLLPFHVANLDGFLEPLKANGFPAVHHSPDYVRLYRPAYRVVRKEFLR